MFIHWALDNDPFMLSWYANDLDNFFYEAWYRDTTSRINSSTRPLFDKIGRHEAAPSRRNYSIARWPYTDRLVSISNELQIWSRISPLQRELDRNQKR